MRTALFVLVIALVGAAFAIAPVFRATKDAVAGSYIVVYHKNITDDEFEAEMSRFASIHAVSAQHTYRTVIKGFSAQLDARQLAGVRASNQVDYIEEDQMMYAYQCETQNNADWGLTRVSQVDMSLDGTYHHPSHEGGQTTAYIIDTGIYVAHTDFGGRAIFGFKSQASWSNTDANGHGTHVASTVGGYQYGVAKSVQLIAVKVLGDNGSGTNAGVIAGVDWAASDYYSKSRPGVANMSLGGGYSAALNSACDSASQQGLVMVVAAGNDNNNACNYSPASADDVISTGATDQSAQETDVRSYFSNWGTCVDAFAPGSNILGAWIGGTSASRAISGTSMASPHIAGVAALVKSANPNWTFDQVKAHIESTSSKNKINLNCGSAQCNLSPNFLVYNGC